MSEQKKETQNSLDNAAGNNRIEVSRHGQEVTISIIGDFTFSLNGAFREATDPFKSLDPADLYTFDLGQVRRLDSSALGMLMIFFGSMGADRNKMRIINASPAIRRVLDIAIFQEWFRIE